MNIKKSETVLAILIATFIFVLSCQFDQATVESPADIQASAVAQALTMEASTQAQMPTSTPLPSPTPGGYTETPGPAETPPAVFEEMVRQLQELQPANVAFNKPEKMRLNQTASIELILSLSLSESDLASQIVERGGFVTSTADPGVLIAPNGENTSIETAQINITPRMKAVLRSQDSGAFQIEEMHDSPEQIVGPTEKTTWRWSVTAMKEGPQTLELIIYRLVQYDGGDYWPEVETYKANIVVEVTMADRSKLLDWKWIATYIVTFIGAVLGILKWLDERKKKAKENQPPAPVRRIK